MHPLKAAIAALHHAAAELHERTQDFEFTDREKDHIVEALVGYVPVALGAAQDLLTSAFAYITSR